MTADSPVFNAICRTFEEAGWKFHRVEGEEVVEASFEAHHTRVPLHVQAFPPLHAVSVVARSHVDIPRSHLQAASELLARLNGTLTIGGFEVDPDASHAIFRATNLFPEPHYEPNLIGGLVHTAIAETDRITPYLAVLCKEPEDRLPTFDVPALLGREDLLPQVGDAN